MYYFIGNNAAGTTKTKRPTFKQSSPYWYNKNTGIDIMCQETAKSGIYRNYCTFFPHYLL